MLYKSRKEEKMQSLTYSGLRAHLAETMKEICTSHKEILVTTKGNKNNVVMLSQEDYEGLKETLYLLSSPVNAKRLLESVEQYKSEKFEKHELLEC